MKKLVKKYAIITIIFFVIGLIYGAIFFFILQGENASILFPYVKGLFVGFLVSLIYLILTFSLGCCLEQEDFADAHTKPIIVLMNVVATVLVSYGITILTGNKELYPLTYAWMYIVNLLFSGVVVGKANYDANVLRNFIKESEKNK